MSKMNVQQMVTSIEVELKKVDQAIVDLKSRASKREPPLTLHRSGKHFVGECSVKFTDELKRLVIRHKQCVFNLNTAKDKMDPQRIEQRTQDKARRDTMLAFWSAVDPRIVVQPKQAAVGVTARVQTGCRPETLADDKLMSCGIASAKRREAMIQEYGVDFVLNGVKDIPCGAGIRQVETLEFIAKAFATYTTTPTPTPTQTSDSSTRFTPELWNLLTQEKTTLTSSKHAHLFQLYMIRHGCLPFMLQSKHRGVLLMSSTEEAAIGLVACWMKFDGVLDEMPKLRGLLTPTLIKPADFVIWMFETLWARDDVQLYNRYRHDYTVKCDALNSTNNSDPWHMQMAHTATMASFSVDQLSQLDTGREIVSEMRLAWDSYGRILTGYGYCSFIYCGEDYLSTKRPYAEKNLQRLGKTEYSLAQLSC